MRKRSLRFGVAPLVLCCLALSACGTTVATTGGSAAGALQPGGAGDGLGGLGTTTGLDSSGDVGSTYSDGTTAAASAGQQGTALAPGQTAGGVAAAGAPQAGPGTAGVTGPVSGRGFTAKEIYLGFGTQDDVNKLAADAGFQGVTFGDTKAQVRAVLDYVNARGGVLGRKLVPVFKDASSANSQAVEGQNACTAWTQDSKVFAVLNPVGRQSHDTLYSCLNKAKTPLMRYIGANTNVEDYARYEQYAPANIAGSRMAPVWMERLKAMGYFTGWDTSAGAPGAAPVKVGLVLKASHTKLRPLLEAELRRQGFPADEVFVANEGAAPQDYQAPGLRFAAKGITHVIVPSAEILYFMSNAESQQYRPRYALNSWVAPGALLQITAPPAQLRGSMGVGYVPAVDVDNVNDPGDVSPATTLCRKIMQDSGQDTTVRLTFLVMLAECDMVFLLQRALTQQGLMTNSALQAGIASLGGTYRSALTFKTAFGPTRSDGAAEVRDLAFVNACTCYRYTGPRAVVGRATP